MKKLLSNISLMIVALCGAVILIIFTGILVDLLRIKLGLPICQ